MILHPNNFASILILDISLDDLDGIAIEIEPINRSAANIITIWSTNLSRFD